VFHKGNEDFVKSKGSWSRGRCIQATRRLVQRAIGPLYGQPGIEGTEGMRAEAATVVDEIRQAMSLLRRHL
jgi:hypothetical protein